MWRERGLPPAPGLCGVRRCQATMAVVEWGVQAVWDAARCRPWLSTHTSCHADVPSWHAPTGLRDDWPAERRWKARRSCA